MKLEFSIEFNLHWPEPSQDLNNIKNILCHIRIRHYCCFGSSIDWLSWSNHLGSDRRKNNDRPCNALFDHFSWNLFHQGKNSLQVYIDDAVKFFIRIAWNPPPYIDGGYCIKSIYFPNSSLAFAFKFLTSSRQVESTFIWTNFPQ